MANCSSTNCKTSSRGRFCKSKGNDGFNSSFRSSKPSRNESLEVHLSPRPCKYEPYTQPRRLRQSFPPLAASQSSREVSPRTGLLLSGVDLLHPFHRSFRHGHLAHVLLPPGGAPCLPGYERSSIRRFEWRLSSQSSPTGRAFDGPCRLLAHVSRVLPRRLQTAPRVQLGGRCRSSSGHAVPQLHGLSLALGPACLLGRDCRHQHHFRDASSRQQDSFPAVGRKHRRGKRVAALLRPPCRNSSADCVLAYRNSFLACAKGRRFDRETQGRRWKRIKSKPALARTRR